MTRKAESGKRKAEIGSASAFQLSAFHFPLVPLCFLLSAFCFSLASGQSTGDILLTKKTSTGYTPVYLTPTASSFVTTNGSGTLGTTLLSAIPAGAASTLTGTTLASNVVTSSLTTIGTLVGGAVPTTLLTGTVTNAQLAGSIAASKLVGSDIATVGTLTSGTASTGFVLGGVTMTLGSDANGDTYYRAGGVLTRLAKGTAGQVLTMNAGATAPEWAAAAAGGAVATDTIWDAAGDLVQGTGANTAARVALGTAGQVLKVNAGATAVEWGTVAGTGTIIGSTGATDNRVLRADGTGGLTVQSSAVTIADTTGAITAGTYNLVAVGLGAAGDSASLALGVDALASATPAAATNNVAVGNGALYAVTTGDSNTAVGSATGYQITTGGSNTILGQESGISVTTGSGNLMLGYYSGHYETGSNSLYIDNQDRTDTAGDKAKALLYGTFNATAASQQLTVNAGTLNLPSAVINLGHATDTTISRVSAGLVAVEGVNLVRTTDITNAKIGIIGGTVDGGGSAITTGKIKGFIVCKYSGTIAGWAITVDSGTATVKVWKIATGTAKPTSANSISTAGVALSSGSSVTSTTTSDFTTTTVTAGDIVAFNIEAVATATELTFQLFITKD